MNDNRTIFALASAPGRAGVAVFRISGADSLRAVRELCVPAYKPEPRVASLRKIRNPNTGVTIDEPLVLYFQGPHSFTGEDVVEFHVHGGRAIANAVLEALSSLTGFRLAEPGEFTRRGFENGKMDLTEAEAIADLIHAETEAQRKQAFRQMGGALGKIYEDWRDRLKHCLAMMEAAIDFSDEDLPDDLIVRQSGLLQVLRHEIVRHLNDNRRGERLRDGFSIVLLGPPNAGKSSILNALARRDAAIVSPIAGTTRDVIDVHLDIGGYPVILSDTAGLRATEDSTDAGCIEHEGIRRACARAAEADLKIVVLDGALWPSFDAALMDQIDNDTMVVVNKCDLLGFSPTLIEKAINGEAVCDQSRQTGPSLFPDGVSPVFLSAMTGEGMDDLLMKLGQEIDARFATTAEPSLTRARHRAALEDCVVCLDRALAVFQADLRAEDVRLAMRALGRITGRVDVEDLLDLIFKDFCIGK